MKSLIDYVLFFSVEDSTGKPLREGDYFNTHFAYADDGPFLILSINQEQIVYVDMCTGYTIQHDMRNFKVICGMYVYRVEYGK